MMLKVALAAVVASLVSASVSGAATVTSNSFANTGSYDFSTDYGFTAGPVEFAIGATTATFTSVASLPVFGYSYGYGLAENGDWDGMGGYAGLNDAGTTSMSFTFANAIAAVGGFINYAPVYYGDAVLSVYGAGDVLLETFNLSANAPIATPYGHNEGAFRGFSRSAADIRRFELTGAYIVIDDLVIGETAPTVPLPASLPLLTAALGLLGIARQRRKQA